MSLNCPFCGVETVYDSRTPKYRWCSLDETEHYYSIHLDADPVKEYFRIDWEAGYLIAIRHGGQTQYLDASGLGIHERFWAPVEHSFEEIQAKFNAIKKMQLFK